MDLLRIGVGVFSDIRSCGVKLFFRVIISIDNRRISVIVLLVIVCICCG